MTKSISESRARLGAAIAARNAAQADFDALSARAAKLEALASASSPAESALAILESREASAMAEWSRSPEGEPPRPDVESRVRLTREVEAARISSASARAAANSLTGERQRLAGKIAAIEPRIACLAAEIAASEILPALSAQVDEAARRYAIAKSRVAATRDIILRSAEADLTAPGRTGVLRAVEVADKLAADAIAFAKPADNSAFRADFAGFLLKLADDAAATLDVAP